MKKELNILRNKEDGDIKLPYKGINLNDYECLTVEEFIEEVESAETWDMIDSEVYEKALEDMGLDYNSYNDPDEMWESFLEKAKHIQ